MREDPCIVCGRWTGVYDGYDAVCKQCQDDRRYDPYIAEKVAHVKAKAKAKLLHEKYRDAPGFDMWREQGYEKPQDPYEVYREKERYEPPESRKKRKEALAAEKMLHEKRVRLQEAMGHQRECAECGLSAPHDENDFLCVKCRDGEDAIPPGYGHYWTEIVKAEAA